MGTKKPLFVRIALTLMVGAICLFLIFFDVGKKLILTISYQIDDTCLYSQEVTPTDRLTFNWIHSFEHIPWIEEYTIESDDSFTLNTIRVAGFGAGIPENKGTVSFENNMIVMSNIDQRFDRFDWIHSQTALTSITVNGTEIVQGPDLPHHEPLTLTIKGKIALWPRFPSTK